MVLLTLQTFDFLFSLYYDFKLSILSRNFIKVLFFSRITEKNALLIYINQEYYCRLFRKVCFCICPLSFIQTCKSVLFIGTMYMYACANNYWKCVSSKCLRVIMLLNTLAYILEFSRKRNIMKENIYEGVRF